MTVAAQTVMHRGLDGSTVEFRSSLPESALSLRQDGTTTFAYFDVGSPLKGVVRREFSAGSAEFQRFRAEVLGVTLSERYTLPIGTVRAGSTVHEDEQVGIKTAFHLGVWEDSVSAFSYGGRQSDLIALFTRFAFHLTPEGPWMRARAGGDAVLVRDQSHAPCIAKPVPTLGLLQVHQMRPEFATPPAARIRTESEAGGKVYVEHEGTREMHVLLVAPTTVCRLLPHEGVEEAKALTGAATLEIAWQPPGQRT